MMHIKISQDTFSIDTELSDITSNRTDIGAVVCFTGIVRSTSDQDLIALEIEHYPGMTAKAVEAIATEAISRWNLLDCAIIHRFGRLLPGEQIMMVATLASHRKEAFNAAEFLMDYLKTKAPFWKKEFTKQGAFWVNNRIEDDIAIDRWE